MAKGKAPVSLTGGAGFYFEDLVAACFLVDLLAGTNSLGAPLGVLKRLDWQVRDTDWNLDDLAATCTVSGVERIAVISCKSDKQVTSKGFPAGFVEAAWEHWHGAAKARKLRENQDVVVLVTGELAEGVREVWENTLKESSETDPNRMVARLRPPLAEDDGSQSSALQRALFESLRCPERLKAEGPSDDAVTVQLLRHVRLLHFDFASSTSHALGSAIRDCQKLLSGGDASKAEDLWRDLVGYAATQRSSGGSVDRPKLLLHLRDRYDLIGYPDDSADRLSRRFQDVDVLTFNEWESRDKQGFAVPWVDFSSRSQIVDQIRAHLRSRSGLNVLHLAGLSGVGKTRMVLEACRGQPDLSNVLYLPRYTDRVDPLLRYLIRSEQINAHIVIDELPLEDLRALTYLVQDCSTRLRLVTIGPARRDERGRAAANVLIVPEPDTTDGVLAVVRLAGDGLQEAVLESIASFAAHDLRLALMLVEATRQSADLRDLPIRDGDDVWRRVTTLFRRQLGDVDSFQAHYPYLTVAIDVGIHGDLRSELLRVAGQFTVPVHRLDDAIGVAGPCGLGIITPSFFEAAPRALAGHLFRRRIWGSIQHRLDDFLNFMPDRLLRRFVERCQECVGPERLEMEAALASFFQQELGAPPRVTQLVDRERSRLFKAWAELDPGRGLAWLAQGVAEASDNDLTALDGAPDGSGGWRGRRQVVWLLEALAGFGEWFWVCEKVLYRLAQVETEPSIGNNSTVIWRSLFLPLLAFTEVPFPDRANLLLRRLAAANERTMPLVFSAIAEALGVLSGGRPVPPDVVGGRLVPEPWQPGTWGDVHRLQIDLARRTLDVIRSLPDSLGVLGRELVVSSLPNFARFGLIRELREMLISANEETKRAVRAQLRHLINMRLEHQKRQPVQSPDHVMDELCQWETELRPSDLAEQIRELTSLDPWEVMRVLRTPLDNDPTGAHRRLAQAVIGQPYTLESLVDWFDSENARSALNFGVALGQLDREDVIAATVSSWLAEGRCKALVCGYLHGIVTRQGTFPSQWAEQIDQAAKTHPEYATILTVEADFSQRGFQRVLRSISSDAVPMVHLQRFASPNWEKTIGVEERAEILQLLLRLQERERRQALAVALNLGAAWTQYGKVKLPTELAGPVLEVLRDSLDVRSDPSAWSGLLESLALVQPELAADLAAEAITSHNSIGPMGADLAFTVLLDIANDHARLAMHSIGRCLLDHKRQMFFTIRRFEGLFEAIGLAVVRRWVTENGDESILFMARQLDSPRIVDNEPFIPPVTDWVMGQFGEDERVFREFILGRHQMQVLVGHARDRHADVLRTVEPFRKHPLPWVRRWADWELKENEREAQMDDFMDDRHERL